MAFLATTLALLSVSPAVGEASDPGGSFFDDDGNVHEGAIEAIAAEAITRGCNPPQNTNYCPPEEVTRGQMAAFLVRGLSLPEGSGDTFSDDNESVFEADIDALAGAGITRGCNPPVNDRYCPDDSVTRAQMAAFLVRAFQYSAGTGEDLFDDDDGSIFEGDIDRLGTEGVTRGCNPPANDRYCPNDPVLRDQMASFLTRALELPAAPPPPRADTSNGVGVSLLDLAASQGCEAAAAVQLEIDRRMEECTATTTLPSQQPFYVRHGWGYEGWSSLTAAEQQAWLEDARFDLSLNHQPLDLFESFFIEDDLAHEQFRYQFPGSLTPTTHTIVGDWVFADQVELRVTLEVTVVP